MASTHELKDVIKETLENRGSLGQIKARIRAEVFSALDDQSEVKPPLSNENMIINELIREYLDFNKYKYSSSVLVAESGQPKSPLDRDFLTKELNIKEDYRSKSVPLLYSIISNHLRENRPSSPSRQRPHGAFLQQLESELDNEQEPFVVMGGKRWRWLLSLLVVSWWTVKDIGYSMITLNEMAWVMLESTSFCVLDKVSIQFIPQS